MSEPSTDSETPDSDATQRVQFEGRTVCVIAPEDLEALEKQRNALSRDLAARDAITAERIAVVVSEYNDEHSRACKLAARVKELEAERDKQKIRGDNHAETLRGIAAMDDDPARMRLWARDSLSGQFETLEATILRLCDERNALTAERDGLKLENSRLGTIAFDQCDKTLLAEELHGARATIEQLQTELAALSDARQKMWVRLNAAENAKLAGDKMIARLMKERDELERNRAAHAREAAHEKQLSTELREVVEQLRKDGEAREQALKSAVAKWMEFYEAELERTDREIEHWKKEGDMYGVNFHQGRQSGLINRDIGLSEVKKLIPVAASLSQGEEQG